MYHTGVEVFVFHWGCTRLGDTGYRIGNYILMAGGSGLQAQNQGGRHETSMTSSLHRLRLEPSNSLHPGLKPPSFIHQNLDMGQSPSLAIWRSRASLVPAWRRCAPSVSACIAELPPSPPGADQLQKSQLGTANLPPSQSGDAELRLSQPGTAEMPYSLGLRLEPPNSLSWSLTPRA